MSAVLDPDPEPNPTVRQNAEAFARGVNRGWDHANFCTAYTPGQTHCDPTETQSPSHFATHSEFVRGWHEGIRRYLTNQWPDGTPNHDDDTNTSDSNGKDNRS